MKKISFLLSAVLLLSLNLFSQAPAHYIISGRVLDAQTKQPLFSASVFAVNTTIGTATDADGHFTLELPNGGYDLVVTFTGYQAETKRITTTDAGDKNIIIEIKQKEKEMQDVVIKASNEVPDGWEKYGDFFLDNFIGKTTNSKQCTLQNKDVLKFYFNKRKNRLKILASAPLEIVNNALGYTMKYTLDSFTHEYNTQVSLYSGYPLFEEMKSDDPAQKEKWAANRQVAYNGSILHFMRSLYHKKLKEEGFEIQFLVDFNDKESAFVIKDFYGAVNYSMDDSTQTVDIRPNQDNVAVIYKNETPDPLYLQTNPEINPKFELSVLTFLPKGGISIEQNGYYYDQNDITINSYWAWEKMGDMLPWDYKPL